MWEETLREFSDAHGLAGIYLCYMSAYVKNILKRKLYSDWHHSDNSHWYVISHDGVEEIIKMLKEKGKLGDIPCIMCEEKENKQKDLADN